MGFCAATTKLLYSYVTYSPGETSAPSSSPATSSPTSTAVSYSKLNCDDLQSCSPAACVPSTDSSCSFNQPPADHASKLAAMSCKQCSQSTDTKCSNLASLLKKNQGVAAAYCNAEFLIVWSSGKPSWDPATAGDYLNGIPLPPGGDASCRVRTSGSLLTVFKIPLTVTTQPSSNTVANPLPGVPGMPEAGAIGMAIDGVPMFPNYNNRGQPAWVSCEVDRCNAHSGKGNDYHYHGDPYGTKCLYNDQDYSNTTHPPIIGFALDGYAIYGRYTEATQDGIEEPLDSCGGHTHIIDGVSVYHYHASVEENVATDSLDGVAGSGFTYTAYRLAPTTCWKGNVDLISNFWDAAGRQPNYDRSGHKASKICVFNSFSKVKGKF